MQAMMRQAQKMQQDAMKAKEELESSSFEGSASGGLVKTVINGKHEIVSITIDKAVVDPDDVEMLEDLIVASYNEALSKLEAEKSNKLGAFGGLI